ncbi:hypothetical protein Pcinc_013342 [Petrolisthes cinctipes]|uniref:Uncharacterized protein n=1 Tax=Petrolisthes cinctipes TaxID=88211 RepID=A0AAE1KST5_PETCI|nr:hypothetical protein Pcinc_013342 [Petrolisthes cinctipes]
MIQQADFLSEQPLSSDLAGNFTSTEEVTGRENVTSTEEDTGKENVTITEEDTGKENVTITEEDTGKENVTSAGNVTGRGNVTSTGNITADADFPYCLLHLPAGDHHKPVLAVLRESDALQLSRGPYFSKVKAEQADATGVRSALLQCKEKTEFVAFNPSKA